MFVIYQIFSKVETARPYIEKFIFPLKETTVRMGIDLNTTWRTAMG